MMYKILQMLYRNLELGIVSKIVKLYRLQSRLSASFRAFGICDDS